MNKNNQGVKVTPEKHFSHALSSKKHITYDIYENRFVAWAIKGIIEQLRQYKKHVENKLEPTKKDYTPLLDRMKKYQSRLQGVLHKSPFNEVSEFEKRTYFSTSLTRGSGYRDFIQIYLLLTRGLELADNDIFKIEQKNISTLYEYWCFLKLVHILKEQNASKIDYQDLIKIKATKFHVQLEKGQTSKVVFKKGESEETTTIYFNKEFKREGKKVFTYNQRPDYSIEFKKKGFEKPFWYIFDAKYRFDESKSSDKNAYNVPEDAIGQLHRYRDAILHTEPTNSTYRSAIKNLGGVILYPYPLDEKDFENNIYYKSIHDVNIGALPFLPSKSGLVTDLLNELINKRLPEEHFERFIEMDNSEYIKKRDDWKEWMTIGVVPKDNQNERLRFISEKLIFHIPFNNKSHSKLFLTKKLLVCKSGKKEAILYNVKSWEILTAKELRLLGTSWNHRGNKYIVFHLDAGETITTPDALTPITYRFATFEGLKRYRKDPEMGKGYFYMTCPDAARLYEELMNIKKSNSKFDFQIKWANDENDFSLVVYHINGLEIYSSDKYKELHFKFDTTFLSLKQVLDKLNSASPLAVNI